MDARDIDNHIENEIERLENEIDKDGDYKYLSAQMGILNELLDFIVINKEVKMKYKKLLNILCKTWKEDCPSRYKWHFYKGKVFCDFDWRTHSFTFYKAPKT